MTRTKKWILGILTILTVSILGACASEKNEGASAATDETYEINVAHGNQPDEPIDQLAEKWKELAEEKSNGAIKLNFTRARN